MTPRRLLLSPQERALAIRIGVWFGIVFGLIVMGALLLLFRMENQQQGRTDRAIARIAFVNCREIQELKYQNRKEALREFSQLDRNLRILGIKKTDEIVDITTERKDAALERNKSRSCITDAKDLIGEDNATN